MSVPTLAWFRAAINPARAQAAADQQSRQPVCAQAPGARAIYTWSLRAGLDHGLRLAARGGTAKKKAVIAVARKLAVFSCYGGRDYEPLK